MVIQVINLSSINVFNKFSEDYKIFRDVFHYGLFGLEIRGITSNLANTIQKIVLQQKEICYKRIEKGSLNLLLTGSLLFFHEIARKIVSAGDEEKGYRISKAVKNFEEYDNQSLEFGSTILSLNKPLIMGILNVTPDSFSDGGKYNSLESAVKKAEDMIKDGADIIDVGGESTRPGSEPVSVSEEIKRTIPVIKELKKKNPDVIISIDTTKSEIADKALESGASIVNDINGLSFDKDIAPIVYEHDAAIILMHIKGTPKTMQQAPEYKDVISEVYDFLYEQSNFAMKNGIKKIIVDPGIGFGKRVEDNFEIIKRLYDFKSLGFPIMIGLSRKSFIGKTLDLDVDHRDIPTTVLETVAVMNSARIIRTHNVKLAVQSRKLIQQIIQV